MKTENAIKYAEALKGISYRDWQMLKDREPILVDTVELMTVKDKYGLDVSVSDTIYKKSEEKVG